MKDQKNVILSNALNIARETGSEKLFIFLINEQACRWCVKAAITERDSLVAVIPESLDLKDIDLKKYCAAVVRSWSGNQTRFSRIKYAFLQGVMQGIIGVDCNSDSGEKRLHELLLL